MERLHHINPFAKRDEHSKNTIITYKVLSIVTWLLSVIATIHYSFNGPCNGKHCHGHDIWRQNDIWVTAFRINRVMVLIYWLVMFIVQAIYVSHLFSNTAGRVNQACSVGSHFIVNNLLHFAWVMLFVNSHFAISELMLILNFINLSSLYFRHPGYARFIHAPVVSGPLAWTFVAIYWNGAIMIHHPNSLPARIVGNIFIWSILAYGMFFITYYKDYTMGFNLSVLAAAIGVAQFEQKIIELQWIFAFTIMAVLFLATLVIAVPAATGRNKTNPPAVQTDAERAPLLGDN